MNFSPHFTLAEAEASETAARQDIDNTLPVAFYPNATALAVNVLELARNALGALHVNSWYRSPALNSAIGGAKNSQHMKAQAVDLIPLASGVSVIDLFIWMRQHTPFDQIILEFGGAWCHVSYDRERTTQRGEVLAATRGKTGTVYEPITNEQLVKLKQ